MAGIRARGGGNIGMVDGVVKYIEFSAEVDLGKRESSAVKKPYYDKF
jgi:hypothetical protein